MNTLLVFSYVMVMAPFAIASANYGRHFVPEGSHDLLEPALAPGGDRYFTDGMIDVGVLRPGDAPPP